MKLLDYFKSLSLGEQADFAKKAGTTPGYLLQAAYGYKKIGPEFALRLEGASEGAVKATELSPDFPWDLAAKTLCTECTS